jgi:hypothetical protein
LEDCSVVAYARYWANELSKSVGLDGADGRRRSDGRSGHICHGPYITLGPGQYTAGFYVRRGPAESDGDIEIEVCAEHGQRMFASLTTPVRDLFVSIAGLIHLDFSITSVERGCELRLHIPSLTQIEVSEAVLFRRDTSMWDAR